VHGTNDKELPYEGGPSQGNKKGRIFLPVSEAVNYWRTSNHIANGPARQELFGAKVVLEKWMGRSPEQQVALYTIRHWGHQWPGSYFIRQCQPSCGLEGFDAADLLWHFFKGRRRPPS
jgi:polyhydroxybutyrate depolymerase